MLLTLLPNLGFAASVTSTPAVTSSYGVHFGQSVSTGNQLHDSQGGGVGTRGVTGIERIRD